MLKKIIQMLQVHGQLSISKSLLNSVNAQVKAAEIANEGITVEYETGLEDLHLMLFNQTQFY